MNGRLAFEHGLSPEQERRLGEVRQNVIGAVAETRHLGGEVGSEARKTAKMCGNFKKISHCSFQEKLGSR